MRFGINLWLWVTHFSVHDLDLLDHVRAMGFDWVEIGLTAAAEPVDYRQIGRALRSAGLGVSVSALMGAGSDLSIDDATANNRALAFLRECVDAAEQMGASLVSGPLYAPYKKMWQIDAYRRKHELEICAANLRRAARYAATAGVTLAIEPVNRYESGFINTAAQAVELVDLVGSPGIGMVANTFHMNIEEKSPAAAIYTMRDDLALVHAADNDRGTPGSGSVDWTSIATSLKQIDFQGPVVIEAFTDASNEMARLASVWRPTAASQDELASRGLIYLKALLAAPHSTSRPRENSAKV